MTNCISDRHFQLRALSEANTVVWSIKSSSISWKLGRLSEPESHPHNYENSLKHTRLLKQKKETNWEGKIFSYIQDNKTFC